MKAAGRGPLVRRFDGSAVTRSGRDSLPQPPHGSVHAIQSFNGISFHGGFRCSPLSKVCCSAAPALAKYQAKYQAREKDNVSGKLSKTTVMVRLGMGVADWCERWFPDALVFAILAIFIVFVVGLFIGNKPLDLAIMFGSGFWSIIPFTMQMALIIIGGYVVASSPPVYRVVEWLASVPKTPRGAITYVAMLSMASSMIHWGFCLIFSGFLVTEICRRIKGIDYRAMGAAAFLGGGSIWTLGLSSSAALLMATKGFYSSRSL